MSRFWEGFEVLATFFNADITSTLVAPGSQSSNFVGFGIDLSIDEGDVLADKYRIFKQLGKGGFGAVYLVEDLVLHEQIAV